jgi:hypothetical protein
VTTLWPLRGSPQTSWNASTLFKARRPWDADLPQTRWHAGLDLKAAEGDDVLAPEDLEVVDVDRGWDGTAKATLVHTASGHSLLLGCTALGSAPPPGTKVPAGHVVARIGYYTRTVNGKPVHSSMLHLQVYDAKISATEANKWQSWKVGADRPPHLIDPKDYLSGATPVEPQAGQGGELTEDVPCPLVDGLPVCLASTAAEWATRLAKACVRAQLAHEAAGWPKVDPLPASVLQGEADYSQAYFELQDYKAGKLPADPAQAVTRLVAACKLARAAEAAFLGGSPQGGSSGSGGDGSAGVILGVVGGLVVVGGALALVRRRRR